MREGPEPGQGRRTQYALPSIWAHSVHYSPTESDVSTGEGVSRVYAGVTDHNRARAGFPVPPHSGHQAPGPSEHLGRVTEVLSTLAWVQKGAAVPGSRLGGSKISSNSARPSAGAGALASSTLTWRQPRNSGTWLRPSPRRRPPAAARPLPRPREPAPRP